MDTEPGALASPDAVWLSPSEAAQRLDSSRSLVYRLVRDGRLDAADADGQPVRISAASLARYQAEQRPPGAQLAPPSAWAVLALASGDAAFRAHVASRLSDPDRSRAKTRLAERGFLMLLPRLHGRAGARSFEASAADRMVDLLTDERLVLAGPSAARAHGWPLPGGDWPLEMYVAEDLLVDVVEGFALDRVADGVGDVVLRSVPGIWPFPPHARVAPSVVAALDLAEHPHPDLASLGRAQLAGLAPLAVPAWHRRPTRPRPQRPIVPTGARPRRSRLSASARFETIWDDRAEQDARHLVALLFVAAGPQRRADVAETLRISPARLEQACHFVRAEPPYGLVLVESGERLGLVSAPDCAAVVERHFKVAAYEPLSQAALESLSIVVYSQPVTRADIRHIRGVDSDSAIETLMSRGLIAEDPRFGGRGRPSFLVSTAACLRLFGVGSLAELPPLPANHPVRI
ncbi:MAG: SMC-Scp complex subunit ScpB [Candidatus Dormibacteraeota bacterium]|nr:SMC-Scp complex subunit ScpB [Candidatus Dormibacteraeota bacterium]